MLIEFGIEYEIEHTATTSIVTFCVFHCKGTRREKVAVALAFGCLLFDPSVYEHRNENMRLCVCLAQNLLRCGMQKSERFCECMRACARACLCRTLLHIAFRNMYYPLLCLSIALRFTLSWCQLKVFEQQPFLFLLSERKRVN